MELDHIVGLHYLNKIDDMDEVDNIDEMNYMIMWKKSFVVIEICLWFF